MTSNRTSHLSKTSPYAKFFLVVVELKGASLDPCSHAYVGAHAESEPEVSLVTAFLDMLGPRLKAYIAYHSYSQFWMSPFAYTKDARPPHYNDLVSWLNLSLMNVPHEKCSSDDFLNLEVACQL